MRSFCIIRHILGFAVPLSYVSGKTTETISVFVLLKYFLIISFLFYCTNTLFILPHPKQHDGDILLSPYFVIKCQWKSLLCTTYALEAWHNDDIFVVLKKSFLWVISYLSSLRHFHRLACAFMPSILITKHANKGYPCPITSVFVFYFIHN